MKSKSVVTWFQKLKWSVNHKIGACFAVLVTLICVGSILVFVSILNLERASQAERQKSLELSDAVTFNEQLETQLISYSDAIYLTHQKQVNSTYTLQARNSLGRLKIDDPDQLQLPGSLLFRLDKSYTELSQVLLQLDTLIGNQAFDEADKTWTQNQDLRNSVTITGAELQRQIENDSKKLVTESQFSSTFTKVTAVVVGVLSALFAFVLARLISATIGQPLAATRRYLEEMSAGDFSSELRLNNRDELGDMARALNTSVKTLHGIIESFNIGSKVADAADNLKYISSEQSNNASQQVSHVTQISGAMSQLNAESQAINANATQVALAAQTTLEQAQYVATTTAEVTHIVQRLKETVDEASNSTEKAREDFSYIIKRLNEVDAQSQNTEAIVNIISGITSEIQLLALNAAIEAAGAGQFGERFGVVAREVKELATRSVKATEQVNTLVAETRHSVMITRQEAEQRQQSIGNVVNLSLEVEQVVSEALSKVDSNQNAVEAILEAAENARQQSDQIKSAAYEQQVASQQILFTINAIMAVVKTGADGSNQVASTSAELSDLSYSLATHLADLKLPLAAVTT